MLCFLLLNHADQRKSVYVKQSPKTKSVQPGDSVTLECSLLSKNKENADQCPGEHNVSWFRSGSGESRPSIIYTHSEEQKERSCVFSLSKTIHNSSDTGTYYCAVATCGQILFGEGTTVETSTTTTGPICPCARDAAGLQFDSLIVTAEDPHLNSLDVVVVGGNVTYQCSVLEKEGKLSSLYKQSLGQMAQPVFKPTKGNTHYLFTIRNVRKEDEAHISVSLDRRIHRVLALASSWL
ncbi:hypothetical protein F7725_010462 [Dissostichus mawsoni]|uniref:Ig-like domain-containing protein n=1 Tax=Dissostichus mawsoni TaxID=36200 RepID=A0A7J5XNP7_DISMA|nr:hypothetical protein F7725_010462 [Dissostichus mawsoni]